MTRKEFRAIGMETLNAILGHDQKSRDRVRNAGSGVSLTRKASNWLHTRKLNGSTNRDALTLLGMDIMMGNPIPNLDGIDLIKITAARAKYSEQAHNEHS